MFVDVDDEILQEVLKLLAHPDSEDAMRYLEGKAPLPGANGRIVIDALALLGASATTSAISSGNFDDDIQRHISHTN